MPQNQGPDEDILKEVIELLRGRVKQDAATFLIKIKAHRGPSGEPFVYELADNLAEEAREATMPLTEMGVLHFRILTFLLERTAPCLGRGDSERQFGKYFCSTHPSALKSWRDNSDQILNSMPT